MTTTAKVTRVHVSYREAAERHAVSVRTVMRLIESGAVSAKAFGRRRLVNLVSLDAYFDELEDV